jgi:hypothetical protein
MPAINPLQALVHPQTQKKKKNYPAWIVNPQPHVLKIRLFWQIALQIRNCESQSPKELMSHTAPKSKFAAQILDFEELGLGLDNCGRTTKNAYCHIYSLCPFHRTGFFIFPGTPKK